MAKQIRTNTTVSGITSLLSAINQVAKAELGNVSQEEQAEANRDGLEAVQQATAIIGDSNIITAAEMADENIAEMHEADAEAIEAPEIPEEF